MKSAAATDWFVWAYGKAIAEMSDAEIQRHARTAWDVNDGEQLRAFRAEAKRRGIQVV